ncbi:hypothetical protein [Magnetospirillum gryphiswaldense]|uniref:Prolyl 4-hydroxylase alpha subunit Fe(2+) 2OG dioxygenase domain-containing protein n=1 Tax=Magnetospirillum gryphiswaldense TaxID=55518 RepID=A4TX08_9PROT|nr:hypothetical protein [Magnetospirillum gryphiswaldense]AVM74960.1 hypothetical protein MSR1_24790 [Magnetospirillum gryphiswaldense MSR-1]AVM78863.1 hypothetical protein MSR1L_24790 [Magnetospirillum gryphiswaldense]CAM75165.1 hypothetical protein MGR_0662 [Magnetospirillum gryphiswaldense MSR-1]
MFDFINLAATDVRSDPGPHYVKDGFLRQDLFDQLRAEFPTDETFRNSDAEPYAGGRADLEFGMDNFSAFIGQSSVWRDFIASVRSRHYAEFLLDVFGKHLDQGRPLQRDDFVFVPTSEYIRTHRPLGSAFARWSKAHPIAGRRMDRTLYKTYNRIKGAFFPDHYYIVCQIAQSWSGYVQPAHRDSLDRGIVTLIYFNDPVAEGGGEGGEFGVFRLRPDAPRQDSVWAHPAHVEEVARVRPRPNLGVGLLNTPSIYHSGEMFQAGSQPRKFMYIGVARLEQACSW